jgi:NADH:ubiquinone oxidoreductase subunit 4 (subunit M)
MLSALILVPLLGAAIIGFWPAGMNGKISRGVALVVAGIAFLWSVILAIQFNPGQISQQFAEFIPWVDALGLNYTLGVDGLSLPLLVLNCLLTCIAIYSSDESLHRPRFYYSLILLLRSRTYTPISVDCNLGWGKAGLCSYEIPDLYCSFGDFDFSQFSRFGLAQWCA